MNKLNNCVLILASCFVKDDENILRIIAINYECLSVVNHLFFVVKTDLPQIYKNPTEYNLFYVLENNNQIIKARLYNSVYNFHIVSPPLSFLEFDENYKIYESITINPLITMMKNL